MDAGAMDLRQLEFFVAVASEKNFTRAAGRLHIVQSGLSASIHALEHELGAALFIRTTRRVELTPIGRAFLVEANRVLAAATDARHVVDEMRGLHRGTLSIGMFHALAPLLDIADILGRFRAACPGVEIRLASGGSMKLIERVRGGELDLALAQLTGPAPPGLRVRPESLRGITKPSQHETDRRQADKRYCNSGQILEILGQATAAIEPSQRAFYHPTSRQHREAFCLI
jgi:DNA-binding transcriptional LysR family regulator